MTSSTPDILWVDDEFIYVKLGKGMLEMSGFSVRGARSVSEAKQEIQVKRPDLVIVDVMMPNDDPDAEIETHGGHQTGVVLAKWIKQNFPEVPFVGCSIVSSRDIVEFFTTYGAGFLSKPWSKGDLTHLVTKALGAKPKALAASITPFIVHGHDDTAKLELKNFLQNSLGFAEPIILHEQPSCGRTIIEKFEEESQRSQFIFVLMTPDDKVAAHDDSNSAKRRARQNVIFELGYFLGALGRRSGRILLLHKGPLELPTDVSGVVYIDISTGIESAGEHIRREVLPLLEA